MIDIDTFLEQNKNTISKGWVAYDKYWGWQWFSHKPEYNVEGFWKKRKGDWFDLGIFLINPILSGSSLRRIAYARRNRRMIINPMVVKYEIS